MKRFLINALALSFLAGAGTGVVHGQGIMQPGGGAMHLSMAGTSTAVGCDAVGALFWNPAVISGLPQSEVVIGANMIIPHNGLTSTVPAGIFGPLGPATTMTGRTNSDNNLTPTTAIGLVYRQPDSPLTYGLGLSTLAAGGTNYPGDANNPLLAPTGPLNRFILGPQASSLTVLAITPTVSYQFSDRLAIGGGPIVDVMPISFDPAFFGPPSHANPLAPFQFPTGSHSKPFWGGGFRGGATYRVADHVMAGFGYTSPQWFETLEFNARKVNGDAFQFRTPFSMPQIFSTGLAYDGIERLLLASDLRWFDYSTTKLLGQKPREGGAGWDSIWAVSVAAKYCLTDRLSVQGGYLYNENPISSNLTLFNTQLPSITQHTLTTGAYFQVNESIGMSLAYAHGFENTVEGAVDPVPGTSSKLDVKYDSIIFGIHVKFGGPRCRECCPTDSCCQSATLPNPTVVGDDPARAAVTDRLRMLPN